MKFPIKKPNYESQITSSVLDELRALSYFFVFHWYLVVLFVAGAAALLIIVRPFPPTSVTIATGQPGSTYDVLGRWYQQYFEKHGIELTLVPTDGAIDNVRLLESGSVGAAFSQGGVPVKGSFAVQSLGSVLFEPLWLFYRGKPFDGSIALDFLKSKQISIGAPGSGTRFMVLDLIREHRLSATDQSNLVEMNGEQSVDALLSGKIDGMFLLAATDSSQLQRLLEDPEIQLWNFSTARAISGKIPYAYDVVFPRGAITLSPIRPTEDVNLVATTATVLAPAKMHPAIQYLFMMAARNYYNDSRVFFDRAGGFPAFLDNDVDKSPVATKYLAQGNLLFEHYVPFWVASFLDRAWLLLLAAFAVLFPLARMVPQYRKFHFKFAVDDFYIELCHIDQELNDISDEAGLEICRSHLQHIEDDIYRMWIPSGAKEKFYSLCNAVFLLHQRIERIAGNMQFKLDDHAYVDHHPGQPLSH